MAADNINENPEITVTTVARDKRGRFVSVKKPDQVKPQVNLEASLKEILKFLVDNQKSTLNLYNSQSEKIDKTNDHLGNIENELSNLEKYFGQLTSFFSKKDEEDQKDAIENSFQKINNQHLKNILIVEQKQLKELEMLNEQFIDFFEMNEKNIQDQKEQKIEREREAAAPPPTIEQPKQEAAKDIKKNEGMFSGFGSIVKNTFGGLLGIGKGIFKGLGTIFSTLFSIVSVPFKFISSALGSILSFIPGFGIISKFMPSFSMGMGGLLSTLGIGALGYVGFKYLTDDKYKAGVDKYMGGITKFFSPFINAIKGFFDTPIGQAISSFVGNLWEKNIKPGLEGIKQGIVDTLKTFIGEDNWGQLKKSFLTITEWITDKLPKSYEELSRTVKLMANNIVYGFNTLITFLSSIPLLGRYTPNKILPTPFKEVESKSAEFNFIPLNDKGKSIDFPTTEKINTQDISKINLPSDINEAIDKKFSPQDAIAVKQLVKSESGGKNKENVDTHDAGFFQFAPSTAWELLGKPNIKGINLVNGKYEFSDTAKIELSKRIRSLNAEQQTDLYLKYINPLTKSNTPLTFENLKAYGFASGEIPKAMKSQDLNYKIYGKDYGKKHQHFRQMQELSGGEGITYGGMLEWIRRTYLGKTPQNSSQNTFSNPSITPKDNLGVVTDVRNLFPTNFDEAQQNERDFNKRINYERENFTKQFFQERTGDYKIFGALGYGIMQIPGAPFGKGMYGGLFSDSTGASNSVLNRKNLNNEKQLTELVPLQSEQLKLIKLLTTPIIPVDYRNNPPPNQNNFAFGGASPTTVNNTTIINNSSSSKSSAFNDLTNKKP